MDPTASSPHMFPVVNGIDEVAGISLVLVVLLIGGRIASNLRLHQKIYVDDFAAVAGFVFFLAFTVLCIGMNSYARYGQNARSWDATAPYFQKAVYSAEVIGPPASLSAKASVLLLYLRIFHPAAYLRRGVGILVVAIVIVCTPSLPLFSFYCAPNATITVWNNEIAQNCVKANAWSAFLQAADVVLNVSIFALPMPSIFSLQISLKRRLQLVFVLLHGVFAIAASIVGAVYRANLAQTSDPTAALWFRSAAFLCFVVELGMTLVSGSFHACYGYVRYRISGHKSPSQSRPDYYYGEGRSGGSQEKMPVTSEAGVSDDGEAGGRAGMRCSELGPGVRSATALSARSTPHTPPALQPGLAAAAAAASRRSQTRTPTLQSAFAHRASTLTKFAPASDSDSDSDSSSSRGNPRESPTPSNPSELEDPHSAAAQPAQQPGQLGPQLQQQARVVPTGRLMEEIEAAVAAAGTARLVVGHTRPHSGTSSRPEMAEMMGADTDIPPVPPLHVTSSSEYRQSRDAISAGVAEGYREYIVQKVGDEYVVQKAGVHDHDLAGAGGSGDGDGALHSRGPLIQVELDEPTEP